MAKSPRRKRFQNVMDMFACYNIMHPELSSIYGLRYWVFETRNDTIGYTGHKKTPLSHYTNK